MKNKFSLFFRNEGAKKAIFYYIEKVFELIIGFFQTWIIGRVLGASGYGVFVTFMAVTGISLVFFRLGFVSSTKYLILHSEPRQAKEIIGASFVLAIGIGIIFGFFMFLFGFFADSIFNVKIGKLLIFSSPLLIGMILRNYIIAWGESSGRVISMSVSLFLTKLAEFILILIFLLLLRSRSVGLVVVAFTLPIWATGCGYLFYLSPSFSSLKGNLRLLFATNKQFGFRVYMGQVADLTTYRLDKVILAYYKLAETVGNYSLADSGMRIVVDFPAAVASAFFRQFARSERISPKIVRVTLCWLLFSLAALYFFAPKLIELLFKDEFFEAVVYIYPLGVAAFFQGLYQPFNAFLFAKGCGNALRTVSFVEAGFNTVGNIILIKYYGAMGACFVSAGVKFIDFILYIYFYLSYIKKEKKRLLPGYEKDSNGFRKTLSS